MPNIQISFEPYWPIVPMNNVMHKGPLRNVYTPTCPTDVSQNTTIEGVLVLKVLSGGGIKPCTTTRVGTFLIQLIALQLYMPPPPHHTMYVHTCN